MEASVRVTDQCHSCGVCMDVCPLGSLEMTPPPRASIEGGGGSKPWMMEFPMLVGRCSGCGLCETECPFGAIEVVPAGAAEEHAPREAEARIAARRAARAAAPKRAPRDWRAFQPLSSLTRDVMKRPVRGPYPRSAAWKPMPGTRGRWRVWRTMK